MLTAALATGRVANRWRVLATVAAGAVPVLLGAASGEHDLTGRVVVLALAAGAAVGWAVDDPCAEVLGAAPLHPLRRPARVAWALAVAAGVAGAALVVARHGTGAWTPRLAEAAAAAGVALAAGAAAARRANDAALTAVVAGLVVPLVVAGLGYRWPAAFPGFAANPTHGRWWWLAAADIAVAVFLGREPFRRRARQGGRERIPATPPRPTRGARLGRGRA